MYMFTSGELVKFSWWSTYKAPSFQPDYTGHATWHELKPGDTGVVICVELEDVVVLFSHIDLLVRVHESMLQAV